MAEVNPPLYVDVDLAYLGRHLGIPWRDVIGEGIVAAGDLAVSQRAAGANMSVDVAAGACYVNGDDQPAIQPNYRCYNDAVVNLAVAAADATNPRKDIVIAEVLDAAFSGASRLWRLRVVTGTPSGAPVEPGVPVNSIRLATVDVAANATTVVTGNITDRRTRARVGAGGALLTDAVIADAAVTKAKLATGVLPRRVTTAEFAALAPADGDEVYLRVDDAKGIHWHLRYNAGSASAYKWEMLGGPGLFASVATAEARNNAVYGDLATVGPTVTVPRAGEYRIGFGSHMLDASGASVDAIGHVSPQLGATAASDSVAVTHRDGYAGVDPATSEASGWSEFETTLVANDAVTLKYRTVAGQITFARRRLAVTPVRVS